MNGRSWRGDLFEYLERASALIMANLLWVIVSLPLVTMPAATAGLFAATVPWARGLPTAPLADFFGGLRRHWLKGTALGLIDLAIAGLVAANLVIFRLMDLGQIPALLSVSATVLAAGLALMANVYAWPLLVIQDWPLPELLKGSLKLALIRPGWTLLVAVAAACPLLLGLFLPRAVLLLASFAASAVIVNWGAWRVIRRYI
ncbi:MAG: DUF624 domain-containing protein [Chloroflexi bacterium]|nr:DUF624 domain-containing protein [Chloroflexota bacterium]